MICTALHAVDSALGRLDYESLPDQALMEMLIDGMNEGAKAEFQDGNGNFLDINDWDGIICLPRDQVREINFSTKVFSNKCFPFELIPAKVDGFEASDTNMHGTLDTSVLPHDLQLFDVCINFLHGTINLKGFPRGLQDIHIDDNDFSGSLVLSDLPDSLLSFHAGSNQFSGEISLNSLPRRMHILSLHQNLLTGSLHVQNLPEFMEEISLSINSFTGEFCLRSFPKTLRDVDMTCNALNAKAVLTKASGPMHFALQIDGITSVVDENGEKHEWHSQIIGK